MKNTTARLAGKEKSYSKQALGTMIGSFLKKVKETRSGEVLNQSSKQLETSGKPNSPTIGTLTPPTETCHVATTYGALPLLI